MIGINPGAASGGGYKERRKQALDKFASGDDSAIESYWDALAEDANDFWNPRYLARLRRLNLDLPALLVGNIALCATAENKYPKSMLRHCWARHTSTVLRELAPGIIVFMGSASVMDEFVQAATAVLPDTKVIRIAHYAHREGHAYEDSECERVRKLLTGATPDDAT